MVKLGLVTLELMLADLKRPIFAGDMPVKVDIIDSEYDSSYGDGYDHEYNGSPGEDGCGDGGCGCGGDCGGCSHEMMTTPESAPTFVMGPFDEIEDRDRTKDRSPRPDRKKLPSDIGTGFAS